MLWAYGIEAILCMSQIFTEGTLAVYLVNCLSCFFPCVSNWPLL